MTIFWLKQIQEKPHLIRREAQALVVYSLLLLLLLLQTPVVWATDSTPQTTLLHSQHTYSLSLKHHNIEELRQLAVDFVRSEMPSDINSERLQAARLDPRLKLARCSQKPEAFLSPGSRWQNKVTVGLRCNTNQPWSLYVPVHLYSKYPVVMSKTPLMRGQRINREDLELRHSDSRSYQNSFKSIDDVVGRITKYSIPAGRVVNARMLDHAWVVKKGESVLIEAISPTLNVKMQGVALQNGLRDQTIQVENSSSGKEIDAVVTAQGIVQVKF